MSPSCDSSMHSASRSDTDSDHESIADSNLSLQSDPPSDAETQPSTPPDPQQLGQVAIYSPGRSFTENDSDRLPLVKSLGYGDDAVTGRYVIDTLTEVVIPDKFWELLRRACPDHDTYHGLRGYVKIIWELQMEWVAVGRKGFVTKSIEGMSEAQFWLMQKTLERSWKWKLRKGEFKHWISFLRCMRLDFWPEEGVAVAIAPTFDEDFTSPLVAVLEVTMKQCADTWSVTRPCLAPKCFITTSAVQFGVKFGVILRDKLRSLEPGTEVFMCMVAQTRDEFMYQARKMAFVAQSLGKLQGFVLALLGELDWQDDHSLIYEDSIPGTKEDHATGVELCVLSYQRDDFGTFVESAARAAEFHDWEIDTGFMRLHGPADNMDSGPATTPPEGLARFDHCIRSIISSYLDELQPYSFAVRSPEVEAEALLSAPGRVLAKLQSCAHRLALDLRAMKAGRGRVSLLQGREPYYFDGVFRADMYDA